MSKAEEITAVMLEDDYDEHVKAHQMVQKWDNAHGSYVELAKLKRKSHELFREMGQAISLDRALAHKGLKRGDVEHFLRGNQIGSTDNYLRGKLARYIVGAVLKDGRKIWFDKPIPPREHDYGAEETVKAVRPPNAAETRLGKWW
jgi:hypothetical protein